jgi:hypothetical protein
MRNKLRPGASLRKVLGIYIVKDPSGHLPNDFNDLMQFSLEIG